MSYIFWFLLFLTIPIAVHLFNFRRAKKLLFTNVRFIRTVSSETKAKTRLKHLLILGARILTFFFLISAFIASVSPIDSFELTKNHSIGLFYLDNSYSSIGDEIEDEKVFLENIIQSKQAERGLLLTNDFSSFSNRNRSKAEILETLETLSTSYISRSISEILNRTEPYNVTYLISDFQDADWNDLRTIKQDSNRKYYLILKEHLDLKNAYVDSAWIERDLNDYSHILLNCKIGLTKDFTEGNLIVKLLGGDGNQVSSVVADVNNSLELSFSLPQNRSISHYVLQIDGDNVEYDNDFHINIENGTTPTVLILDAENNKYLRSIFGNDELFNLNISAGEIDYELFDASDLIVLNRFFALPEGLLNRNQNQKSFVVIPDDSVNQTNYYKETGFLLTAKYDSSFLEIQLSEGTELVQGVYKKLDRDAIFPYANNRFDITNLHEKVISLRDGSTFLGKHITLPVYFFSSPLEDSFTDFPNHSSFLPIMYRIADESVERDLKLFVYPNDYIDLSNMSPDLPPRIISAGVEVIPEFTLRNQKGQIRVPSNLAPGIYHVVQGSDTIKSFGLNLSKKESLFQGPTRAELLSFFEDAMHVNVISIADESEATLLASAEGDSLWKYALILALIFITVEIAFHRYLK